MIGEILVLAAALADPDPQVLLDQADRAGAAVETAAYRVTWDAADEAGERQAVEYTVWLDKWPKVEAPKPPKPNADGSIPMMAMRMQLAHRLNSRFKANLRVESSDGRTVVSDGNVAALIDGPEMSVERRMLAHGGEELFDTHGFSHVVLTPILDTVTYRGIFGATKSPQWIGRRNVHGVECDLVEVDHEGSRFAIYIGAADHYLRRFDMYFEGSDAPTFILTMHNLSVNLPLPANTFVFGGGDAYSVSTYEPPPPPKPLEPGTTAPAFSLFDAEGGTAHQLSDYRGKVVILDFWGSWCGPCRKAMPDIQRLYETYRERGVEVIGLACREKSVEAPVESMKALGCTYELLLDGETIVPAYHVTGYPTLFVIDQRGAIAGSHLGFSKEAYDELCATIDALLK